MPGPSKHDRRHRSEGRDQRLTIAVVLALVLAVLAVVLVRGGGAGSDQPRDLAAGPARPAASTSGTPASGTPASGAPTSGSPTSGTPTSAPAPRAGEPSAVRGGHLVRAKAPRPYRVVAGHLLVAYTEEQLQAMAAERQARAAERARREAAREAARQPFAFRIGSFNVLGSQHTAPGGERRRYPPASRRTPLAAGLVGAHGVDVLGLQELKPDQLAGLKARTGMAAYPDLTFGTRDTDNNILYDPGVFEFVDGGSFTITFMNARRPQTILRLRHRATGRELYVLNMHASAGEGKYAVSRRAGHAAAVAQVQRLQADGIPIFLTGDMNDRAEFFCRVAPPTGMVAAIGGSTAGGCRPAGALAVDWVLGWGGVAFSDYWEDRSTLGRISDHHFVSALATVPGEGSTGTD